MPDVDIVFTEPLSPSDIYTSRFIIENNGNCNIYNVNVEHRINSMRMVTPVGTSTFKNERMFNYIPDYKRIPKKRSQGINVNLLRRVYAIGKEEGVNTSTIHADIEIYLRYTYWNNRIDTIPISV